MSSLKKLLKEKGFKRIKLKYTKTQHLELVAKINNIEGNFILDTGASSTCVGLEAVEHFKLLADLLKKGKAVIDYKAPALYLK